MQVKEKHVLEFQRLYKKIYNEDLSIDEALAQCIAMVNLNEIVYRPVTQQDINDLKERDKQQYGNGKP